MNEDSQWLRAYAERGSEDAFQHLVKRYIGLVFSVALRCVGGERPLAEDVAQTVFSDLARKARKLPVNVLLAGWLHRHTCFIASRAVRSEVRRRLREQAAAEMNDSARDPSESWRWLAPILDESLDRLPSADREAIVLRFYEGRDLRAVGSALSISEDAARKRVARALEKLRAALLRRGVGLSISISGLAALLASQAVSAAPPALAASVFTCAITGGSTAAGAGLTASIANALIMTKSKTALLTALGAAVITTPIVLQHQENSRLHRRLAELQQESIRLSSSEINRSRAATPRTATAYPALVRSTNLNANVSLDEIQRRILAANQLAGPLREREWQDIINAIDPADLPDVIAFVEGLSPKSIRNGLLPLLFGRWAETNPEAAAAKAAKLSQKSAAYRAIAEVWGAKDPSAALAWADTLRLSHEQINTVIHIANSVGSSDPQAAVELCLALPETAAKRFAIENTFPSLAEANPKIAAELAGSLKPGRTRENLFKTLADYWGQSNLSDAIAWVESLPPDNSKRIAMHALIQRWGMSDPAGAIDFAQTLPAGSEQAAAFANLGRALAAANSNTAVEWTDRIPPGEGQDSYLRGLASGLAQSSPVDAAYFVAGLAPGEVQNSAATDVVARWVDLDPQAASAWAADFPSQSGLRDSALQSVVSSWGTINPRGVSDWLAALPEDRSKELAVNMYINHLSASYPSLAAPWTEIIGDPTRRNSAIEAVARHWLDLDRRSAEAVALKYQASGRAQTAVA